MILLDSNVIIDAFQKESVWHSWAVETLADAVLGEGAGVNPVILAEVTVAFALPGAAIDEIVSWGVSLIGLPITTALPAANAFAIYLNRCRLERIPRSSRTPLPDFFIGAHAEVSSFKLATRDANRFRDYFPGVRLLVPPGG